MMHSNASMLYVGEDEEFYFISLPYGNKAFEMDILLPKYSQPTIKLIPVISPDRFKQLRENAVLRYVQIDMPKFSFDSDIDISDVLSKCEGNIWGNMFGFTMFDEYKQGKIGLKQGLSITIDEKGTEAAAITSTDIFTTPDPDSEPEVLKITVDHPFYFFIQEFSTKAMIMSGRISNL